MRAPVLATLALLAGCAAPQAEPRTASLPPVEAPWVAAVLETRVADNPKVDADDPVLWRHPEDPSRALFIGTDKSIGLYVHGMDGAVRQFLADGPMNNVDLRPIMLDGRPMVLVAATERAKFGIMTWLLDPETLKVERWGHLPTPRQFGEPYGFCMGQVDGETLVIPNNKKGAVLAFAIAPGADGKPAMQLRHSWKLRSQTEGCVVNDETGDLYVGEEDRGIWQMSLRRPAEAPRSIAGVDGRIMVADVEGLTLMRDAGRTFLIASSQGDSAFAVWDIAGGAHDFIGRFRVGGGGIDPVTQTDGLSAWSGPIVTYPEGAIAVHDHCDGDGHEDPSDAVCDSDAKQQNYKLVDWRDVKKALGIR